MLYYKLLLHKKVAQVIGYCLLKLRDSCTESLGRAIRFVWVYSYLLAPSKQESGNYPVSYRTYLALSLQSTLRFHCKINENKRIPQDLASS